MTWCRCWQAVARGDVVSVECSSPFIGSWRDSLSSWSQISCHVQPNDVTPRLDLPEITYTKVATFIIRPRRTTSARRGLLLQTAYRGLSVILAALAAPVRIMTSFSL